MKHRYVEIWEGEQWNKAEFKNIKFGMRFRIFEPDGKLVIRDGGVSEFIAQADAIEEDEIWGVEVSDYKHE